MATPLIEIPTLDDTRSRVRAAIISRSGGELRPEIPNTQVGVFAEVMSLQIHSCNLMIQRAANAAFFATATGDALTSLASQFGVHRKSGTSSSGVIRVTITNPQVLFGSASGNFTFQDSDGNQYTARGNYQVNGRDTFDILGQSVNLGMAANIPAGTVLSVVPANTEALSGTTITGAVAQTAFTGGSGVETDEQLRSRLSDRIINPRAGGTAAEWRSWALEVAGVTNAFVVSEGPGVVSVYPYFRDNENGVPSDDNIATVRNYLNAQYRPVTVELTVAKFTPKVVPVTVQITPFNEANRTAVINAVRGVGIAFGELGGGIELYRLTQAVSTLGLDAVNITTPTANIEGEPLNIVVFNPTVEAIS